MSNASHVIEWLDENRRRAFPLTENVNNPDPTMLLDASLSTDTVTAVTLNNISVSGGVCTITTSIGAFTTAVPINTLSKVCLLANGSKLVVGETVNTLPNGTNTTYIGVTFEESTVTHYTSGWKGLQGLSFIGDDGGELGPFLNDVDMLGRYYTNLSAKDNTLIWKIGKSNGTPLGACQSYVESQCGTQVSYINGVAPINNVFKITVGSGLSLTSGTGSITLGVTFAETDICKPIPPTP
jgi:hypothetical protein